MCVCVCTQRWERAHALWLAGPNVSQVFETGIWVFHVGSSAAYGSEEAALISPGSGGGGGEEESGEGGSEGEAKQSDAGAGRGAAAASDRHFAEHILFPDCFGGAGLSPLLSPPPPSPLPTHTHTQIPLIVLTTSFVNYPQRQPFNQLLLAVGD